MQEIQSNKKMTAYIRVSVSGLNYACTSGETEGRFPRLLFSLPSGMDFRYSVSPRWAMPTPAIWPSFTISTACFFHNGIVGKLVPGDSAAFFHEPNDPFCVCARLGNLIQDLLYKFFPIHLSITPFA